MNAPVKPAADKPAGFAIGDSFYSVMVPEGDQYAVLGPLADLDAAAKLGITRAGSLVAVTLIVHGYPAGAPPKAAKPGGDRS